MAGTKLSQYKNMTLEKDEAKQNPIRNQASDGQMHCAAEALMVRIWRGRKGTGEVAQWL